MTNVHWKDPARPAVYRTTPFFFFYLRQGGAARVMEHPDGWFTLRRWAEAFDGPASLG